MYRKRKAEKTYRNAPRPTGCWFCDPKELAIIQDFPNFSLVRARFPYDVWEHHQVLEHLMLVPKRHAASLNELSPSEQAELMRHIATYEQQGYNIYARGLGSKRRSVSAHQHTHLLKVDYTDPKITVFLSKPYFLFRR